MIRVPGTKAPVDDLRKKLSPDKQWQMKSMGENELRGRDEKIELFTILPL